MPLSFNALTHGNPFEFLDEPNNTKNDHGAIVGKDFVILAYLALTQYQRDWRMDGQTDRQTDRHANCSYNSASIHVAWYVNVLLKW